MFSDEVGMLRVRFAVISAVSLLFLSSCACPRTSYYEDTPYDGRTAGKGMHDGGCYEMLMKN